MPPTANEEDFREEVRTWLAENLVGDFASLRGLGGPGSEHEAFEERRAWDQHLAAHGWTCLGWPVEHGGRGLSLGEQVVFHEEYARADAPARVNHLGEELLGPTLIAFGTPAQQERFLGPIRRVEELWCQGYSEPGAGSDLAAVATRARLDEAAGTWVVDGQKVWTSLALQADWCFVLARSEPGSQRHAGLSFLLVPMHQDGVEVRPIVQLTGTSEFNEVFFSAARTPADHVVGQPGDGWRVAMALLGFERGVSTLGQQVGFARELAGVAALARETGADDDPVIRDRLAQASVGLHVMRAHTLRTLAERGTARRSRGTRGGQDSIAKLLWASWHQNLGALAMDVLGAAGVPARAPDGDLDRWQRLFLFTKADTIYGGSDEVQRTILAERVLGLPREPRPPSTPADAGQPAGAPR